MAFVVRETVVAVVGTGVWVCADASAAADTRMARARFFTRSLSLREFQISFLIFVEEGGDEKEQEGLGGDGTLVTCGFVESWLRGVVAWCRPRVGPWWVRLGFALAGQARRLSLPGLFYGIVAIVPLGPTIRAPPSGYGLTALNLTASFFFGFRRMGLAGGRKSKMKFWPTRKMRSLESALLAGLRSYATAEK